MSRGVGWQLVTDVSKEQIGPIYKGVLGCLTIEEGTDKLYRNVGNQMLNYGVSYPKKTNAGMVPKIPSCYYMLLMQPSRLKFSSYFFFRICVHVK